MSKAVVFCVFFYSTRFTFNSFLVPKTWLPSINSTLTVYSHTGKKKEKYRKSEKENTKNMEKVFCISQSSIEQLPATSSRSPTSEWSSPSLVTSETKAGRKRAINLVRFHLCGHSPHLGHIWHYVRSPWAQMESQQGQNCKVEIPFKSLDISEINFISLKEADQIAQLAVQMWWAVKW